MSKACDRCLARAWLIARLAAHLEHVRDRIELVLALTDEDLLAAVGGKHQQAVQEQLRELDLVRERRRCASVRVEPVCRCDADYPIRLRALASPPAILYIAGGLDRFLELADGDPVAVVGARKASTYGLDVARALGRGLGSAEVPVVSGMALGVDAAAHAGALSASAPTIAVLPGGPDRPYPAGKRALHRSILTAGAAVWELPPGSTVWRWMFPARNRVIAGLSAMTVVVEAGERSGALVTARCAHAIGRAVGAVPGRVTAPLAAGPNGLLAGGARVIRGPQDVLDALFGRQARTAAVTDRPALAPELRMLLGAIGNGQDLSAALSEAGLAPGDGLAALATLELEGYVRRQPGGQFSVVP